MVFSKCPRNIELMSLIWSWIPLLSRFCDLGFKLVVYYVALVYRCLEGIHTTMVEVVVVGTVCFKFVEMHLAESRWWLICWTKFPQTSRCQRNNDYH